MTRRLLPALLGATVWGALLACSPALNWRQVPVRDLTARLPCKPDTATRQVALGAAPVELQMMGCEADGALFAVSHIHLADASAATHAMAQWKTLALQALRAGESQAVAWRAPAWATSAVSVRAVGKNADGQSVQARLTWVSRGGDVYHMAVYADALSEAMTQPLLEDLQIR